MNSFLEREKELLKLNETLNQKCAFTLAAKAKVPKVKKATTTKPTKNVRSKSEMTKINSFALADANKQLNNKKVAAESIGNGNEVNQLANGVPKVDIETKNNTTNALDSQDPIEKFLADFTVESKLKLTDDFPDFTRERADATVANENAKPTNGISLIPNNLVRRNVSTDGIVKFLKAKVTILQQELDLSHKDNAKHLDQLAKFGEQQKKIEVARDQSSNRVNSMKTQIEKLQQQNAEAELKSKEKDTELQSLRKECAELKSKLKQTAQSISSLETRLFKSQEDLEYVRKNYHVAKVAEKDLQTTLQQERKFYENRLKTERKEHNDLIAAYKKQMLLVDNLKRQNALLEQAKLVQITEQEFMRCLDWPNGDSSEKK